MADRVDGSFEEAVRLILATKGRVAILGLGKSGLIGKKIAATLASTGTPSMFVHATEAFHGDLGMIGPDDVAVLISYSGETEEVVRLVPALQRFGIPIISVVGSMASSLARCSDVVLDVSVEAEVCPHNLAPTTSTLTTLSMGDALAVALMRARNFQPTDFAMFHPGGSLGRRLLTRVSDVMHRHNLPVVAPGDDMLSAIWTITRGRLGMTLVMDGEALAGIITDGDLRRAVMDCGDLRQVRVDRVMSRNPVTIRQDEMLAVAESEMLSRKINNLVVVDAEGLVQGILQIYDK